MLTKDDLPSGISEDVNESGLKAKFHPNGQLAQFGYFWRGGKPACGWILHLGQGDYFARVERRRTYLFPEDEQDRIQPADSESFETAWSEWLEGWSDSIVEKAHTPATCSFCNKTREQVAKMIAGPAAMICDQCVLFCNDLVQEEIETAQTEQNDEKTY